MPLVSSGVENGNLRQLALERMKDFGADCRDVRYREVGVSDVLKSLSSAVRGALSELAPLTRCPKSINVCDLNRWSCFDEIIPQMGDGKLSSLMKIQSRISWSVCSDCESVPRKAHSAKN